jgi:hypothetical protein
MDRKGCANGEDQGEGAIPLFWGQSSRAGKIKLKKIDEFTD